MHSAPVSNINDSVRHGGRTCKSNQGSLAEPHGMSRWLRAKSLWATLVAIVRESSELTASMRATSGYARFLRE
jgi:hypothetical protein